MLSCMFAGHRQVFEADVEQKLFRKLEELLELDEEFEFYMGRDGEFDEICRRTVLRIKERHPEKKIVRVLVEPYMKQSLNTDRIVVNRSFDEILVPEELVRVHYRQHRTNQQHVRRCLFRHLHLQISRLATSKPAKFSSTSDEKFIRLPTTSIVRSCL